MTLPSRIGRLQYLHTYEDAFHLREAKEEFINYRGRSLREKPSEDHSEHRLVSSPTYVLVFFLTLPRQKSELPCC